MTSEYKSLTPTVYGGDTVTVSCTADMSTYPSDAGIVWKLYTKGHNYTWSGQYTGQALDYPDWVSVFSRPGTVRSEFGTVW